MRQLFPTAGAVEPAAAYGRLGRRDGRLQVRLNMIASLDGAAALAGRSGGLGGRADKAVFAAVRSLADVILVGAGTVRIERYGPARLNEEARTGRIAAGLGPVPPIAVVTRSCRLDWGSRFFVDAEARPIIFTAAAAAEADREAAARVADVYVVGEDGVNLRRAIDVLNDRGHENVLAEGGPLVAATLAAEDLLDEVCLTIAPLVVGGDARRILAGPALEPAAGFELTSILTDDGYLFLRYHRGGR
jgi:riboflavin biosynthesis pyrimidine reductase